MTPTNESKNTPKSSEKDEDNPANWKVLERVEFEELFSLPIEQSLFRNGKLRRLTARHYTSLRPCNKRANIITRYILYAIIEHYNEFNGPPNQKNVYERMVRRRELYGKKIAFKLRNTPHEIRKLREEFEEAEYKCTHAKFYRIDVKINVANLTDVVDVRNVLLGNVPRVNRLYNLTAYGQKMRELVNQGYVF